MNKEPNMNQQVRPAPLRYIKAMDAYRYRKEVQRLTEKHRRRMNERT